MAPLTHLIKSFLLQYVLSTMYGISTNASQAARSAAKKEKTKQSHSKWAKALKHQPCRGTAVGLVTHVSIFGDKALLEMEFNNNGQKLQGVFEVPIRALLRGEKPSDFKSVSDFRNCIAILTIAGRHVRDGYYCSDVTKVDAFSLKEAAESTFSNDMAQKFLGMMNPSTA